MDRKREKIEYDMANFGEKPKILPRFADQAHPWWMLMKQGAQAGGGPFGRAPVSAPGRMRERPPEATFKVTEVEWPEPRAGTAPCSMPSVDDNAIPEGLVMDQDQRATKRGTSYGSNTRKRWTSEMIEKGAMRNGGRLFDTMKPAQTYASDFEAVDNLSSFDVIRHDSLEVKRRAREHTAKAPKVSGLSGFAETLTSTAGSAAVAGAQAQRVGSAFGRGSELEASRGGGAQQSSRPGNANDSRRARTPGLGGSMVRSVTADGALQAPGPTMLERAVSAGGISTGEGRGGSIRGADRTRRPGGFLASTVGGSGFGVRSGGFQRLDATEKERQTARAKESASMEGSLTFQGQPR